MYFKLEIKHQQGLGWFSFSIINIAITILSGTRRKPSGQLYGLTYSLNSSLPQHHSWRSLDESLKRHWQVSAKGYPKKFCRSLPKAHIVTVRSCPMDVWDGGMLEVFQWERREWVTSEINTPSWTPKPKQTVLLPYYSILTQPPHRLLPLQDKQNKGREGRDWVQ